MSFFHTLPGIHFLMHAAMPLDMKINNNNFHESYKKIVSTEWKKLITQQEKEKGRALHEIEKCILGERLAFSYLLRYPLLAIQRGIHNVLKTLILPYSYKIFDALGYRAHLDDHDTVSFWDDFKHRYLYIDYEYLSVKLILWIELLLLGFILFGCLLFFIKACFNLELFFVLLKVLPFIVLMLGITFACGFARLRLPIEPFLIIFGLCGWVIFCKCWR